jgi:hypothetical protein
MGTAVLVSYSAKHRRKSRLWCRHYRQFPSFNFPTAICANKIQLLFGVLRGLSFIGLREVYTLLSVFIKNPNFKNNTTAKVIMSVVPEMIVTLLLIFVGFQTRNIGKLRGISQA